MNVHAKLRLTLEPLRTLRRRKGWGGKSPSGTRAIPCKLEVTMISETKTDRAEIEQQGGSPEDLPDTIPNRRGGGPAAAYDRAAVTRPAASWGCSGGRAGDRR